METELTYHQQWYLRNPDYYKKYFETNREKITEYQKKYKEDNKIRLRKYHKEYIKLKKALELKNKMEKLKTSLSVI